MRQLWTGGFVNHHGTHYTVEHARIYTLPDAPPPIYVSGFGPKAIDVAARIGDGYIATMPDADVVKRFKEASSGLPAVAGGKVSYAPTEDEGGEIAHRLWANSGVPGELAQVLPSPRHFEQVSQLVTEEMTRSSVTAGSDADAHLANLREYADAGYDEVNIANMGPHWKEMIGFYGREVLPAFR
jgi:G6PDH family F420-dependent oxidoreductase